MNPKLICIDYDDTYTDFPELMETIIRRSQALGYEVILATMRYPDEEDSGLKMLAERINVIYTSRKAKKPYLELLGKYPDIWIDDNPKWIIQDSTM